MPYTITPTHIPDLLILEPKVFGDARGFFFECFTQQDFNQITGLNVQSVQDNLSRISVEIENLIQLNQRLMVQLKLR
jgi:dTDP-4-dehydrorhamnose 3,5-epimerase